MALYYWTGELKNGSSDYLGGSSIEHERGVIERQESLLEVLVVSVSVGSSLDRSGLVVK